MAKIVTTLICLLLALPAMSGARVYSFTAIGNEAGLSSNCVKSILQDSYDFMWFGTKNGLDRYDGLTVRHYNCYDEKSRRGNNNIGALYEDKEKTLWVGTDRGVYKYDPMSESFTYLSTKSDDGVSADDWVQDICGDKEGNVWVLVPNQGLFRFHGDKVSHYSVTSDPGAKNRTPSTITTTADGEIYVGTTHEGLFQYDFFLDKFRQVGDDSPLFGHLRKKTIQSVKPVSNGKLLFFTQDGEIYRLNTKNNDIRPVEFSGAGKIFLRTAQIFDDEIWIGTQNGLYIVNETDHSERYLTEKSAIVNGLSDNMIYTIYCDRKHNAWIGTMFGGVSFYQRTGFAFERFIATGHPSTLDSNRIRGLATGADGKIYVGTENVGLQLFDPPSGKMSRVAGAPATAAISLVMRSFGDNIYWGVSRGGLNVIQTGGHSGHTIASDLLGDNTTSTYAVLLDKDGSLWVGADWGLFRRREGMADFERVEGLGDAWVFDLLQDRKGKIWIASMGDGVWTISPDGTSLRHYPYDEAHSNGLRSNSVSAIKEDSKGNIWISTDRGGLSRYNPKTDDFTTYGIENGFPDNVVYDVLEDARGFLWFGTNKGLVKFNPTTGYVKTFTTTDGLSGNQFNYHAATEGNDRMFYFGGINGMIAFNPEMDSPCESLAPVYFTNLKIGNADITPATPDSPLDRPLMFTDRMELPYDTHHITFSVASPNYGNNGSLVYSYRLLPLSEDWITLESDRNISFASLSPGEYTLDVKVSCDGVENTSRMNIEVLRPWYTSGMATTSYVVIAILLGYGSWWFWRQRRLRKQQEHEYVYKMQAEKELYENKVQFFSEIAHEIRTPLTLIQTPLEAIEEIGVSDARIKHYVEMMQKNTSRLLDLVSQLLDFQKLGNRKKKLNLEFVNVSTLISDIAARFQDAITLRKKELTLELPPASVQAMIDKEAVTKIVSNLLSNAMKYAAKDIRAALTVEGDNLVFRVKSDGKKITGEDVYSIFTPFYQIHADSNVGGVGIGLPLSRLLAKLHKGNVELEEDDMPENTFRLTLPLRQEVEEAPLADANPVMTGFVMDEEPQTTAATSGNSLLLVEDNAEMRGFLHEQLSRHFVVDAAENGVEALKLLKDNKYDIIVTDIMMPEMDGYEFCRVVKDDVELSHIPVVFLTAKNDVESKVEALKCGGEAYIEKPFSIKYFRQQVLSLLENRRHERRSLIKKPFFTVDNMKMSKSDEEFMNKVIKTIQEHIADENFNVEGMADVLCMSRSSLLRKIKALFNLSPIELIRLVRLKKAAELIKEGKYRIGDICFMVGISSSSYFSKLFLKQFGITPKAFEMQCQKSAASASAFTGDAPEPDSGSASLSGGSGDRPDVSD